MELAFDDAAGDDGSSDDGAEEFVLIYRVGTFLIVVAALCLTVAFGRLVSASRPAEHWVGGMLLLGVLVKLAASWLRWWTIVDGYEGVADASMYDEWGREFATAWMTGGTPPELVDMTNTNFIRWFTGAVYYVFGMDMITGFIVFGLLAFAVGWSWPGLFLYAVARLGRDAPTQASSVIQAGAFLGGALGPALLGLIVALAGFQTAWYVASASFVLAGGLVLLARRGFRRDLEVRPPVEPFGYGGGHAQPRYTTRPPAAPR